MTAQAARTRSSNSTTGYSGRAGSSRCYARATASRCGSGALSRHPARVRAVCRERAKCKALCRQCAMAEPDLEGVWSSTTARNAGRCAGSEWRDGADGWRGAVPLWESTAPLLRMLTSRSRSKVEPTGLIVTTARQQLTTTSRRSSRGGAVWHRRLGCPSGNPPRTRPTRGSADLRRAFRPSIPNPSLSVDDRPSAVQVDADILFSHRGLPCRGVWCDNPSLDRETGAVTGSGGPAPSCHHLWG